MTNHILFAGPPRTGTSTAYKYIRSISNSLVSPCKQLFSRADFVKYMHGDNIYPVTFYPDFIEHFLIPKKSYDIEPIFPFSLVVFTSRSEPSRSLSHFNLRYSVPKTSTARQSVYSAYKNIDPKLHRYNLSLYTRQVPRSVVLDVSSSNFAKSVSTILLDQDLVSDGHSFGRTSILERRYGSSSNNLLRRIIYRFL